MRGVGSAPGPVGPGGTAGPGGPGHPEVAAGAAVLPCAAARWMASLAVRPASVVRRGTGLVAALGRVGWGTSDVRPHRGDGRFAGWLDDPLRRRAVQVYLATAGTLSGLLDDATGGPAGLGHADEARLRAFLAALADLTCPAGAGVPGATPAAAGSGTRMPAAPAPADPEAAADPGAPPRPDGAGSPAGPAPRRVPSGRPTAGAPTPGPPTPRIPTAPLPGRDVAATPGAVVLRTPAAELIQYLPRTERVHDVPVLVVGPLVHRYYLADLAPGHSLVEHLVSGGLQVFALSRSDPAGAGGDTGPDAYATAVLDAVDACTRITRSPRVVLAGVRSGGLLSAAVQSRLAAAGRGDTVAAAVYLGTALDPGTALPGFRPDPVPAGAAGPVDGATALRSWSWRRGGERVLPYAVDPAAADRLPAGPARRALRHWCTDLLHVPAGLPADLAAMAAGEPHAPSGAVPGTPSHPRRPGCDAYVVAPGDDPAWPWESGHRTAQLLGVAARLVRADGDQAAALVAPDGFDAGPAGRDDTPGRWAAASTRHDGSWWPDLTAWLAERTGPLREAPPELGGRRLHPVHPAPGVYLGG